MSEALPARCNPKYAEIQAAVNRLPVIREQAAYTSHLVDYLALMGNIIEAKGGDLTVSQDFRPATPEMVGKELAELESRFRDLADRIEQKRGATRARDQLVLLIQKLRGPTISALSDAPPITVAGEQILVDSWHFRSGLPGRIAAGHVTSIELKMWSTIARLAASAPIKGTNVGRPANKLAHNVASELARKYRLLTGREPTFTSVVAADAYGETAGQFVDFAREIFALLKIKSDALTYASAGAHKLRGKGRKK